MGKRAEFEAWMLKAKKDGGGGIQILAKNAYMKEIDRFQQAFLQGKDFYSCSISEINAVITNNETDVLAFNQKHQFLFRTAYNKYKAFLNAAPALAHVIVHKAPQNIDITQYVREDLLVNLFKKTYQQHFPGYEFYKSQARICKDFSFLLENPVEKKVLFVVLLPHSTSERPDLLQDIMSDFDTLSEEFKKEDFSVLVVAGHFEPKFMIACKHFSAIKLMSYSINAFELQEKN